MKNDACPYPDEPCDNDFLDDTIYNEQTPHAYKLWNKESDVIVREFLMREKSLQFSTFL